MLTADRIDSPKIEAVQFGVKPFDWFGLIAIISKVTMSVQSEKGPKKGPIVHCIALGMAR